MNWESVTLSRLALASTMYDSLFPFNKSLARLNEDTGGSVNLSSPGHRTALLRWLNDWGCRHLPQAQHEVASRSILQWYRAKGAGLFPATEPLWDLADHELQVAADAYGSLRDSTGAWRDRAATRVEVHIGATAASKVLFAMRPKALMPWDEAMRIAFECDGTPSSYLRYLEEMRELTHHIQRLCGGKGFQIEHLPKHVDRPDSTVLALVNEYVWITETRKCRLPSSQTLLRWAELG